MMVSLALSFGIFTLLGVCIVDGAHFLSDKYIADINSKQSTWQAGRNFDPNTPITDIRVLMGTILTDSKPESALVKTSDPSWPADDEIPVRFDAREKWGKECPKIAEVLDQGRCGSCWAVAAAQVFTDRYCIATYGKHQMRLSAANLLSCCKSCGFGCRGGWPNAAFTYFKMNGLPSGGNYNTTEGCQPYNIQSPCKYKGDASPYQKCFPTFRTPVCHTHCTNSEYTEALSKDYRYGKTMYQLPVDEKFIMKDIMTHGPVVGSFLCMNDFLNYKSGVYQPTLGARPVGGHAIKVIGWGVEKKIPYWLVMNSWNEYWGEQGIVKMRRNSLRILLEERMVASIADTQKRNNLMGYGAYDDDSAKDIEYEELSAKLQGEDLSDQHFLEGKEEVDAENDEYNMQKDEGEHGCGGSFEISQEDDEDGDGIENKNPPADEEEGEKNYDNDREKNEEDEENSAENSREEKHDVK